MNEDKNIYPSDKTNAKISVNFNNLQGNLFDSMTEAENVSNGNTYRHGNIYLFWGLDKDSFAF